MKNIDQELIEWAVDKIKKEYPDDVALLIGQQGACKIPTDEQKIAFDFFVPHTKKGFNLSETFIIEDMGYDLFPMSWERLEGIANLQERITFAFAKGVVIYARTKEDELRFLKLQDQLKSNLANREFADQIALKQVDTAMNIYKTMVFDDDMSHIRKSAGGIMQYLAMAIATFNGTYLGGTYGDLQFVEEVAQMKVKPDDFSKLCRELVVQSDQEAIKKCTFNLIKSTRAFFFKNKPIQVAEIRNYNYEDLASWYYEARYTFRRIGYFVGISDYMSAYELGCFLQIEFDAIIEEFGLESMDLLGYFKWDQLDDFQIQSGKLEAYILKVLKENDVELKIYGDLQMFLERQ